MKFLIFIIMIVTLESLCLFFFKQTFSIVAMSIITACGFLCFTAKNWKACHKAIRIIAIGFFCVGTILILSKEYFGVSNLNSGLSTNALYEFPITFCFILLVSLVFYLIVPEIIKGTNLKINDEDYRSTLNSDYNPATGLPMDGGVDAAGNPYGINSHH